jgi:uncharacterized protein (DUF58 family)
VLYLLIMIVLFIGSIVGRSNMLMMVFAMMVGPFILNGWITFAMLRGIRIERHLPKRTMAGEPVSVELVLHNRRRWLSSWLSTVSDLIANREERVEGSVIFTRVPPHQHRSTDYQLRPMRRGRYRFGPLRVTTRFPLGLVERSESFKDTGELLVYPRLGRLTSAWRHEERLAAELVPQRESSPGVFDDEFHGLREYRWGDNPRAIHWQTSARRNQIMVREFYQSRDRNLLVLLDLVQPAHAAPDAEEQIELCLSFAATICVEHMRQSRDARLHVAADGTEFFLWEGQSRPSNIESMLDTLAVFKASGTPNVTRMAEFAQAKRSPTTRVLFITTRKSRGDHGRGRWREELRAAGLGGEVHVLQSVGADGGGGIDQFIHFD